MTTDENLPNLILQAIGAGAWDWDISRQKFVASPVFATIFGLDPDKTVYTDEDWRRSVHPDDLARTEAHLTEAVAAQTPYVLTYRIIRPDGKTVWVKGQGRVIETDASGRATRMVGALRDVSDSKDLEQTLAESESRLMDIVESVPGAILRHEVVAGGLNQFVYLSQGCAELFDLPMETIAADKGRIRQVFSSGDLNVFDALYTHQASDALPFERKVDILTAQKTRKRVHVIARPKVRPQGGVIWTTVILDITRHAELEADLLKSREMLLHTQKMEAIGELSGGMAHDFNNLLTVILGNLELLKEDVLIEHHGDYIAEAIAATRRGSELTRNLLSFARRAPLRPQTLDINEVIQGLHSMMHRTLPGHIELQTSLMGGLWLTRLDRSQVENAVLNLVINARDAMSQGGKLTIETANIRLNDDYIQERQESIPSGRYVMVAITDTGTGIPREILEQVFQPFFTTKAANGGTGLGLSSVLGFTKQSGGTTQIYSEPGVGTSVKMYFRADPSATAFVPRTPDAPQARAGQKMRILLVEDEAAVRKVMRLRLEAEGCQVIEARSGDEGYRIFLSERPFDLIVTDIVMPGKLMGTGMIRELRKIDDNIRVIFMSGYPTEAAIHGNGVHAEDLQIMKPVSRDDLIRAIEKVMRSTQAG
ncbi:hybrid sensor histidine kinase/response regulator [Puniceibacterium antarcticum]|nr:hybrid sensor histidine kinase/response regulator [Puniceibacterium antarcticum]